MNLGDLKDSLDIEAVEEALGIEVAERRGNEHICYCPLPSHGGNDRHAGNFSINTDKLVYNCFSCGGGGSLTNLVVELLGLDHEEALNWLAQYSDYAPLVDDDRFAQEIDKIFSQSTIDKIDREPLLPWYPRENIDEYKANIDSVRNWLRSRNISDSVSDSAGLGYRRNFVSGIFTYPALIIPIFYRNELRGWQARYMGPEPRPEGIQKYKFSSHFPANDVLYNFDNVLAAERVIVVESPMTVLTLESYGYDAVATFGASFPDPAKKGPSNQIKLLQNLDAEVILSYDNDKAGKLALKRLSEYLDGHVSVSIVPPFGKEKADLGDLQKDEVDILIESAVPSFLWDN